MSSQLFVRQQRLSIFQRCKNPAFLTTERYFSKGRRDDDNKDPAQGIPAPDNHRKENFAKKFIEPALRGELNKKHETGIPRLAARRHKAHLHPISAKERQKFPLAQEDTSFGRDSFTGEPGRKQLYQALSPERLGQHDEEDRKEDGGDFYWDEDDDEDAKNFHAPELIDDDKYYWIEEKFDNLASDLDDLELNEEGEFEIEYDEADIKLGGQKDIPKMQALTAGDEESDEDEVIKDEQRYRRKTSDDRPTRVDPEEQFFYDQNDVFELAALDESLFPDKIEDSSDEIKVLPLQEKGPDLDDFLQSMINHPAEFAEVSRIYNHPGSLREPMPIQPKTRRKPPLEFLDSYMRFIYVCGLPPLVVDGEPGNLDNPLHLDNLQQTIARLARVDSSQVFVTSPTSGFVGLESPRALADILSRGPKQSSIKIPPKLTKYKPSPGEFGEDTPDRILRLHGIRRGNTSESLARALLLQGSDLEAVYDNLSPDDIHFESATTVLLRFASAEQANSARESAKIKEVLKGLCQYPIQFLRARRELIPVGKSRKPGSRLIVDGEMPSKDLFISHVRVIHLRNVDPSLNKAQISAAFDPFSLRRRDVAGSVEIVKCSQGLPTGCVYVGFDSVGEAEACINACSGRLRLGDRVAQMRVVRDRNLPGVPRPDYRPMRSVDELLKDLNNWEQYVDPKDLQELEAAGVSKDVLDEALRGIRYHNATFGPLDGGIRSESLEPEKDPGEQYRELVQMYVSTLKECIATPEDVGELYESQHFPGEPVDMSIFEEETKRQETLRQMRSRLYK